MKNVLMIVGSLRKNSFNRQLAKEIETILADRADVTYLEYSDLFDSDLYNEISLETCVNKRISQGGTSVASVEDQINYVKQQL